LGRREQGRGQKKGKRRAVAGPSEDRASFLDTRDRLKRGKKGRIEGADFSGKSAHVFSASRRERKGKKKKGIRARSAEPNLIEAGVAKEGEKRGGWCGEGHMLSSGPYCQGEVRGGKRGKKKEKKERERRFSFLNALATVRGNYG